MSDVILIVGQTGAGKSACGKIIADLEIPVLDADKIVGKLYKCNFNNDEFLIREFISLFGNGVVINGIINKEYIAANVFSDSKKLLSLESIIHPLVKKSIISWIDLNKHYPLVFVEATRADLNNPYFSKIVFIKADLSLRIKRIMNRNNLSLEEATKRASTLDPFEWEAKSNYQIINNGNLEQLNTKVFELLNQLK